MQCEAPKIDKLVHITPISLWFMVLITILTNSNNYGLWYLKLYLLTPITMVYGTYNELVTGANLNQQTSLGGRAPPCVNYGDSNWDMLRWERWYEIILLEIQNFSGYSQQNTPTKRKQHSKDMDIDIYTHDIKWYTSYTVYQIHPPHPSRFLVFYVVNPPIPQYHQTWDVANYSKMGVRSRFIVYKYKPNNHSSKPLITYNL